MDPVAYLFYSILFCSTAAESPGFLEKLLEFWKEFAHDNEKILFIVVTLIISAYFFQTLWFLMKVLNHATYKKKKLFIGPIKIRGEISNAMNSKGFALALRTEFQRIKTILHQMENERPASYHAPSTGIQAGYCYAGLRISAPIPKSFFDEIGAESIEKDITLKIGQVTIPVSDIWNNLMSIISVLPVLFRKRYQHSLIQVSVTGYNKQSRLTVHRRRGYRISRTKSVFEPIGFRKPRGWNSLLFSRVYNTQNLDELNILVRDAAFMILAINDYQDNGDDSEMSTSTWDSMCYLVEGFNDFEHYKNTGEKTFHDNARLNFEKSIEKNPDGGFTAMFYYSVMIMVTRKEKDIQTARSYLEKALNTRNKKLKAFIYLGLAYCHAQSYHRLGKNDRSTLKHAEHCLHEATKCWDWKITNPQRPPGDKTIDLHPLMNYTHALVLTVDEESPQRIERFQDAAGLYWKAIEVANYNSIYVNNLGVTLMKLMDFGCKKLDTSHSLNSKFDMDIPQLSEFMLLEAISYNEQNALGYANLCTLYSLDMYRYGKEREKYRHYSAFYGKKAVRIQPDYINGHVKLAQAYIRYDRLDEAKESYYRALEEAEAPYKNRETMDQIRKELEENHPLRPDGKPSEKSHWDSMIERQQRSWSHPDEKYFEPH